MDNRWKQSLAALSLAAVLASGTVAPALVYADGAPAAAATEEVLNPLPPIGSVSIGGNSTIEVSRVVLSPVEDGNVATFTLTVHNKGATELQFIDYWVRLHGPGGTQFPVGLIPEDKLKNRIPAYSSVDFRFSARVGKDTKLTDLSFNLIRWDFTVPNFERQLGSVKVPDNYNLYTPVGKKRMAIFNNEPVKTGIKRIAVSKNDTDYMPTIYFEMENSGTRAAKLPEMQFSLRTSEGLEYPLTASGLEKDMLLNPRVVKEVPLTGTLPVSVGETGWQLVVTHTSEVGDGLTVRIPVASFQLPQATTEDVSLGQDYEFSTPAGTYTAELESLKRLPWEDEDLLTGRIIIKNKGKTSLPVPNLAGYFKLDDAVDVEARVVRTDKILSLRPGQEVAVQYISKVPYTYDFSEIKLYMQESREGAKEGETPSAQKVDLLQFVHNSDMMIVPAVGSGQPQSINDVGRQAQYAVKEIHTYAGKTGDVLVTLLEVENKEKRFTELSKLVAHFVSPEGTVLPTEISEVKSKVGPNGKVLLHVSGIIPEGLKANDLQLFIGQGVIENRLVEQDEAADAYVQPLAFALPYEHTEPQMDLKDIKMYPYTVSLSNIGTTLNFNSGEVKLSFDYLFEKDLMVLTNTENHKVVFELVDKSGTTSFSQEFGLGSEDTPEQGEGTSNLQLGSHSLSITKNDPELVYRLDSLNDFTLNVYYQIQPGQRKLLASREFEWFKLHD
ncbi:hypothetical protein [Paenibacillus senegalensis]|uniref:hypothetical protein n=1 Tax=Paenibacillus senegalensis TaxID=1465766 RepID=UPI000288BDB7|nr:hypothetical protein [Paenibacillus senegalensis]